MNYFIHLAYHGGLYSGWQMQDTTDQTVQFILTEAIQKILRDQTIAVNGCGRTDAGVHASQYFAQFQYDQVVSDDVVFKLNKTLPADISVFEITAVGSSAHSRYDVLTRTYDYFFHKRADAFLADRSVLQEDWPVHFESMQRLCGQIESASDFKNFCRTPEKHNTTLCRIAACQIRQNASKDRIQFTIRADRFLRSMVRIIAGQLFEVGSGRLSEEDFQQALFGDRSFSSLNTAYPQGLYLSSVHYPYLEKANLSQGFLDLALSQ